MLVECPHCYDLVLPSAENQCPACGGDVTETAGVDRTKTLACIRECDHLPDVCIYCGSSGAKPLRIKVDADAGDGRAWKQALVFAVQMVGAALGHVAHHLHAYGRSSAVRIDLDLPVSDACRPDHGKPKPKSVAWERHEIEFIVHRRFAEELTSLRIANKPGRRRQRLSSA